MKLFHAFLFTFFFSFILYSLGYSQSIVFSDNFDSYTAGQQVACQNSTDWTTWSNLPCDPTEDAYVSNAYANSGANSVIVVDDNDLVHPIANYTSGKYEISFYMYIPSGMDAYWNTLQAFTGASSIWGMEAMYPVGGVCTLNAGGNAAATFNFSYDTWMFNELIVDLDNDLATLKVDGTEVYSWQWSLGATGSGGILQLGGNDFYGYNQTGGSTYYFDDYTVTDLAPSIVSIAYAREDLNGDYVPDHLGDTLTVQGIVISPNYQTTNISYFIDDGTGGIDLYHYGSTSPMLNLGDEVMVTGEIQQYHGVTEIVPADTTDIVVVSTGNQVPSPILLTLEQYFADPETYESRLLGFTNLDKASGTWPASGNGTLQMTDGVDTIALFIDVDTDIPGNPEPTWPQDIIAIGSQYTTSTPPDNGYEIEPRYYATDFLPPNSLVPVELTSFKAEADGNSVNLNWNTASELNNNVFEIQRNSGNGFVTIGSVKGQGTTSQPHSYSFVDNELQSGTYSYRLKQIDFNGTYSYSKTVEIKIMPAVFSLQQNYPNPFNPSTKIQFGLTVDSKVSLNVFNVLGQEVASLVNGQLSAGSHTVTFDASNLASGIYLYKMVAVGTNGKNFTSVKKMILTK